MPAAPSRIHRLKRGLTLPLAGAPAQAIGAAPAVGRVGLLGADYLGLKPTFRVRPGDRVVRGQCLFEDKWNPGLRITSPAAGTVAALHRGERRAFQSLVIDVAADDGPQSQVPLVGRAGADPMQVPAETVRALLVESGLWAALRARPFSHVPAPDDNPYALFITAIDSRPHAPSVEVVLAGREAEFATGVACLSRLTEGTTYVCTGPATRLALPDLGNVRHETFEGPHPAGNAGTHIHRLAPVGLERSVWHIGYQDVVAIGHLVRTGRLDVERVVALAGPSVLRPRLVRTRLGASTDALLAGDLRAGVQRLVSGSVLDGRTAQGESTGYLGRYHQQVSALAEAVEREFLGWIKPGTDKFSVWGVVAGAWMRAPRLALDTTTNGGSRAMVPIGSFERVMPLDLMPTFLLRALLMGQDERAEALGALELDEEDLAPCTFVCPGKAEYGPLLRAALTRLQKEAA